MENKDKQKISFKQKFINIHNGFIKKPISIFYLFAGLGFVLCVILGTFGLNVGSLWFSLMLIGLILTGIYKFTFKPKKDDESIKHEESVSEIKNETDDNKETPAN